MDDSIHDMNELIESEQELNAADFEALSSALEGDPSDDEEDEDERSLIDSDEEKEIKKKRKE